MCFHPKSDPAVAVTGRHWKNLTDFCALLAFNLMDQILWLLLFPALLHPLNLRIIRQRQPHAPQQPYNNRATAATGLGHGCARGTGTILRCRARMARGGAGHAAVPCPALLTGSGMDGWTDGQVGIPGMQPPICQTEPVPKPLLQTRRSPGTGLLPDPGAERGTAASCRSTGVSARSGRAFPHGRCPVNLHLHREAKQTPGTAESAARAAPGAGPASPRSRLERGRTDSPPAGSAPSCRSCSLPWNSGPGTLLTVKPWHKLGEGNVG